MPDDVVNPKDKAKADAAAAAAEKAAAKALAKTVTISAADAAKAVKREVPVIGEDGKPNGETKAIEVAEDEVFAWSLRGEIVTVVTTDGQKLVGSL